VYRADRNDEPNAVGRGQFPAAQSLGHRERGVDVDEAVICGRDRVGADVALLDPRQSGAGERWYLWADQWLEADVTGLGQEHSTHTDWKIVGTRAMLIDMGEVRSEARPGLDHQH
jgi:hypothetical protein